MKFNLFCCYEQKLQSHGDTSTLGNIYVLGYKFVRENLMSCFMVGGFSSNGLLILYVKVESMRLDWYSKLVHQDLIRADLYQVRCI